MIESLCNHIVECCTKAGKVALMKDNLMNCKKKKCIPGWNAEVAEYKKTALFWHRMWMENDKPVQGWVCTIRKATRARYHKAIKKCRQKENHHIKVKMAEAYTKDDSRNYWHEAKKIRNSKRIYPTSVNNCTKDIDIANVFADKYKKLFNEDQICNEISELKYKFLYDAMDDSESYREASFSSHDVVRSVSKLKYDKIDGNNVLLSDHIMFGSDTLYWYISILFTMIVRHGYIPSALLESTLTPIVKDRRGNLSDIDNYRAIALSSSLTKVFETCILLRYEDLFHTEDLQFGFKNKSGTDVCSFVLKETIAKYVAEGSRVYSVFIDASKAFDRLNHIILFSKLKERGFPPIILRSLLTLYSDQKVFVRWKTCFSNDFGISNGVKQGGILSPYLFNLYLDNLLVALKKSQLGCHMGPFYAGALCYADDLTLLSPSLTGLQGMLNICSDYCINHNIKINEKKSKAYVFTKEKNITAHLSNLTVKTIDDDKCTQFKELSFESCPTHLGHIIQDNISDDLDIDRVTNDFRGRANAILADFNTVCTRDRLYLMKTFCSSFYGSQLWALNNNHLHNLYAAYRKAVRKSLYLHPRTHNALIPILSGSLPIECMLEKRFLNFYNKCKNHSNNLIRYIAQRASFTFYSVMGGNVRYLNYKYLSDIDNIETDFIDGNFYLSLKSEICETGAMINELLYMRDFNDFLSFEEYSMLLQSLCTE